MGFNKFLARNSTKHTVRLAETTLQPSEQKELLLFDNNTVIIEDTQKQVTSITIVVGAQTKLLDITIKEKAHKQRECPGDCWADKFVATQQTERPLLIIKTIPDLLLIRAKNHNPLWNKEIECLNDNTVATAIPADTEIIEVITAYPVNVNDSDDETRLVPSHRIRVIRLKRDATGLKICPGRYESIDITQLKHIEIEEQ
jgi:hypothetical protein